MNNIHYIILGVKVVPGPFGIKVFTKDKNLADRIYKYWYDEFETIYLTGDENGSMVLA